MQALQSQKDEGSKLIILLRQSCEKLHSAVSPEVRDSIQVSLCDLQRQWESCCDDYDDRMLFVKKEYKKSADFDRKYEEIRSWLHCFKERLEAHDEVLLNSVPEKKQAVRSHLVSYIVPVFCR